MPIPSIRPYPMPTAYELPENQVDWRPHPARAVVLVHDMQRYFVDFFSPGESPLTGLLENIARLRASAADLGMPVIYTAQPGGMTRAQRGLLHDFWGQGMTTDPRHTEIVAEIAPEPHDVIVTKWRYSAFHRTSLRDVMSRRGRDQLVICGIYAHIGCLMTASDAFALDVQPFLVADAIADFSAEEHRMALDYAARRCAAVAPTESILHSLMESALEPV